MVSNINVCEAFVNGLTKVKTKHMFIDTSGYLSGYKLVINRAVLYSYGYHFPMAIKLNNCFVVNKTKCSQTTSRHQNLLLRTIGNNKVVFVDINKIRMIINDSNIKSFEDLVLSEI